MSSGSSLPAILLTYQKSEGLEGGQCSLSVLSRPVPALALTWLGSSDEEETGDRGHQERLGCPTQCPSLQCFYLPVSLGG